MSCLQVRDMTPSLPAALPEGLLEAVHTAEHVAALQATSASVSGPTAVRDPDDPGGSRWGWRGSCRLQQVGWSRVMCRSTWLTSWRG